MASGSEATSHLSIYIAPLRINRAQKRNSSLGWTEHTRFSSDRISQAPDAAQSQITPPATPHGSSEDLLDERPASPAFHKFLRAFYPFSPEPAIASSTVTLSLNEGDIILVHSIHTSGWADGTLLTTGARGWLPTNYCEAYDHQNIQSLLDALLTLWDLLRGHSGSNMIIYRSQDFIRPMVAGVRRLLEMSNCLGRDSPVVQTNIGLRQHRKLLLGDVNNLIVKTKRLQGAAEGDASTETTRALVDDLTLEAFKVVIRGVRFLDAWHSHAGHVAASLDSNDGVTEFAEVPPTPPADSVIFGATVGTFGGEHSSRNHAATLADSSERGSRLVHSADELPREVQQQTNDGSTSGRARSRSSSSFLTHGASSRASFCPSRRCSQRSSLPTISHRVSYTGSFSSHNTNLVSQRLSAAHDIFLSHQGSFIGRLHLQSRFPADLLVTTRHSVLACRDLLQVVEAVWERDRRRSDALLRTKDAMFNRISDLVDATRDVFRRRAASGLDEAEDLMTAEDGRILMCAATTCVRAAGECVAKTKYVIESVGDFDLEEMELDIAKMVSEFPSPAVTMEGQGPRDTSCSGSPTLTIPSGPSVSWPLHPTLDIAAEEESQRGETRCMAIPTQDHASESGFISQQPLHHSQQSSLSSISQPTRPSSPYPPRLDTDLCLIKPLQSLATSDLPILDDGFNVESAGTNSTSFSSLPDSDAGTASLTSTRATSPDLAFAIEQTAILSSIYGNANESKSTLTETSEETEARVLERTFAHELIHSRDGQVAGGTLPALVEQLTTHDSTPDSIFVSTFYLTFRLFTTPVEFAEALVDRFDHVADSPNVADVVRLRVYNIFKGWLESHWRNDADSPALLIIVAFATEKLQPALPAAGKRLANLAEKVSAANGPLVPRLLSSIGKTNASMSQHVSPDAPIPSPAVSRSQLSALRNWKDTGAPLSILDFDPLELARQFTIKESRIFCSILPEELLAQEWTKKSGSLAVNVRAMSTLSTDFATLVADTILQSEDVKRRATVIKHWVKVAKKCLELNNYDSLMAIICSLNSSHILRLKRTWEALSQKTKTTLENLKGIVEVSRNYATLRQRLQEHVPPCLPFVGLYLTDLTFVDVGNQMTRQLHGGDGATEGVSVVNFDKQMKTARIIGELQRFQIPYRLAEVPEMQDWIQAQIDRVRCSDQTNVQSHYRRSLLLEPREAPQSSNVQQRPALEPSSSSLSLNMPKERFDFLAWAHPAKEKAAAS